jgi:hypothetical protein
VLVRTSAERSSVELRGVLCRVLRQDILTIGILSGRPTGWCGAVVACRSGLRAPVSRWGRHRACRLGPSVQDREIASGESSESEAAVSARSWAGA